MTSFYIVSKSDDPQTAMSEGAVYVGDDYGIALEKCKSGWFIHEVEAIRLHEVSVRVTTRIRRFHS